MLAGISVEYYTRLERGGARGASPDVLEAVARALQLDEAERAHLFDLVRSVKSPGPLTRRPVHDRVRPTILRVLDAIVTAPAYVRNGRLDILAANNLGRALYAPVFAMGASTPNVARYIFLDADACEFFPDWETIASDAVAILRAEAGRDPYDRRLSDLVGELSTRSDEFRLRWAAHDVKFHRAGIKRLHHPVVGDLTLSFEALEVASDAGQRINIYTAEPASSSDDALRLLASWAASQPSNHSSH